MACQVELVADCGDILSLARSLYIQDKEDNTWLTQCSVSISSCGNLLAVGHKTRLCFLTNQWISSSNSNTFLISWSGSVPADISTLSAFPICPSKHSSQNGPDWFCIVVGFKNGSLGFYTNTGHLLINEKLDDKPVLKISCHTGTFGTLPDDLHILFQNCECTIIGASLFQTLRYAKAQIAKVQAGVESEYLVDSRSIQIKKWYFSDQEVINDAGVVGLELKNTYDHLLAASTYGGYDTWYRSIPPANTLILGAGGKPYIGFHYALEGGITPPLQDVARAVANRIRSALPGWLMGGIQENTQTVSEQKIKSESLSMRSGLYDSQRHGTCVAISPDRRLAAFADSVGRVAVLDVNRGYIVRLFKGYRDAQCAFVQVFEDDVKKPHLSTIKDTRRAMFLIIYNPKKGLIDIRLMQRGSRVAVFTATKNGTLIYNTCGLVGAEPNYTHKKLNLPEFQCVLMDPDGKIKKFNIPFYFALGGEHSARSKDLHILRELRDYLKKTSKSDIDQEEIKNKVSELKTLDLKKHCIEMFFRNYGVEPNIVMSCLEIFWDSIAESKLEAQDLKIKCYFKNLVLITLFYRRINNENVDDMITLVNKVIGVNKKNTDEIPNLDVNQEVSEEFHLLEDDNCILERLLILAQEGDYKAHQKSRVTFSDNIGSSFKEFLSCFDLETDSCYVSLKEDASIEKLRTLSSHTFKSMIKLNDYSKLSKFVLDSFMNPKEVVKLVMIHVMNMNIEEISIELIEKLIAIIYYTSCTTDEASYIVYNEISPWWEQIRDLLVDMPCPLKSMILAMTCKAVVKCFEEKAAQSDEDAWESLTKESAKWGILIGKLEDISILSIIILLKGSFKGKTLPKLYGVDFDVNLKYIYCRGKGSVTELISKWLCSMGTLPESVVANEMLDNIVEAKEDDSASFDDSDNREDIILEDHRHYVDENPQIFNWLSLLRQQFPLSTTSDYILSNMAWEYANAWQANVSEVDKLKAVLECLKNISNEHLRKGLCSIIWTTYVKGCFEMSCRLVNKVGKLPKERLCVQDAGLTDINMVKFLEVASNYLGLYYKWSLAPTTSEKNKILFEKIWDESTPSLVEVAQNTVAVNINILSLNYQVSCTIYYQCNFNVKVVKPLNSLYDVDYHYIFEAFGSKSDVRELNMKPSDKLITPRMKFLNKIIKAALELISCEENDDGSTKQYNTMEYLQWIEKVHTLAELWCIDGDFIRRQQLVGLYHLGYDLLAEDILDSVQQLDIVLHPMVTITAQRLKRNLEHSANPAEWLVTMPPNLVVYLDTLELDASVPAHASMATTVTVLQKLLHRMEDTPLITQNIKLTQLMIQGCQMIIQLNL